MRTKTSELIIITKTKNLIEYILLITEKSPKKYRFTFVEKMHNLALDTLFYLYKANNLLLGSNERLNMQLNAKTNLQMLMQSLI